jgi:filamentous hemagglutinin
MTTSIKRMAWLGRDGVKRLWLEIPGRYRGRDGVFQFIKEADGTINHRLFVPE